MASIPVVLLNGTTADANEVMADFNEIYSNIDQTNIGTPNKTGTGRIVLDTNPTISGLTLSNPTITGNITGTPTWLGRPTFSVGLTVPTTQTITLNAGGTTGITENSANLATFFVNGSPSMRFRDSGVSIEPTTRFSLDGGGNDYLTSPSNDNIQIVTNGVESGTFSSLGLSMNGGRGLFVQSGDNVGFDGGGDTYIYESAANNLKTVVGGVTVSDQSAIDFTLGAAIDFKIQSTKRIYLDGGLDTYLTESSANNIAFTAGGTNTFSINASGAYVNSGSLGVLTASPSYPIHLRSTTPASTYMAVENTGNEVVGYRFINSVGEWTLRENGSQIELNDVTAGSTAFSVTAIGGTNIMSVNSQFQFRPVALSTFTVTTGSATQQTSSYVKTIVITGTLNATGDVQITIPTGLTVYGMLISNEDSSGSGVYRVSNYISYADSGDNLYTPSTGVFRWFSNNNDYPNCAFNMIIWYT